jgi:hypothetical protein
MSTFLTDIANRQQSDEQTASAFWQAAQLNISDPVMMQVHAAIMQQKDFALRAENGSINYFIGGQILIRLGGSMDGVTHLTDSKALLSAAKIALLGHREFVSGVMLLKDPAYNSFIRTLTEPVAAVPSLPK